MTPLRTAVLSIGVATAAGTGHAAYNFELDTFGVWKNFSPAAIQTPADLMSLPPTFYDAFNDLNVPPSAPNYLNGNPASYGMLGSMGPEVVLGGAGILNLNSAGTQPNSWGTALQQAILISDIDPNSLAGLKQGNTSFAVGGIFNLINPGANDGSYGIRLTDAGISNGDDIVSLTVKGRADGGAVVDFYSFNNATNVSTLIDRQVLNTQHDQIGLGLVYIDPDAAGPLAKSVYGAYFFLDDDVPSAFNYMAGNVDIFHGEVFTRAAFYAADTNPAPVPEPAEYLLMLAGLGLVSWRATRRQASSAALPPQAI